MRLSTFSGLRRDQEQFLLHNKLSPTVHFNGSNRTAYTRPSMVQNSTISMDSAGFSDSFSLFLCCCPWSHWWPHWRSWIFWRIRICMFISFLVSINVPGEFLGYINYRFNGSCSCLHWYWKISQRHSYVCFCEVGSRAESIKNGHCVCFFYFNLAEKKNSSSGNSTGKNLR
jgi:hypothetical protein